MTDTLDPRYWYQLPDGHWAERSPTHCPAGHQLGPGRVLIGGGYCHCPGRPCHRTWTCMQCGAQWIHPACNDGRPVWPGLTP